jgi:hypothetical protein
VYNFKKSTPFLLILVGLCLNCDRGRPDSSLLKVLIVNSALHPIADNSAARLDSLLGLCLPRENVHRFRFVVFDEEEYGIDKFLAEYETGTVLYFAGGIGRYEYGKDGIEYDFDKPYRNGFKWLPSEDRSSESQILSSYLDWISGAVAGMGPAAIVFNQDYPGSHSSADAFRLAAESIGIPAKIYGLEFGFVSQGRRNIEIGLDSIYRKMNDIRFIHIIDDPAGELILRSNSFNFSGKHILVSCEGRKYVGKGCDIGFEPEADYVAWENARRILKGNNLVKRCLDEEPIIRLRIFAACHDRGGDLPSQFKCDEFIPSSSQIKMEIVPTRDVESHY